MQNKNKKESLFSKPISNKDIAVGSQKSDIPYQSGMPKQQSTKKLDEPVSKIGTQRKLNGLKGNQMPSFKGYAATGMKENRRLRRETSNGWSVQDGVFSHHLANNSYVYVSKHGDTYEVEMEDTETGENYTGSFHDIMGAVEEVLDKMDRRGADGVELLADLANSGNFITEEDMDSDKTQTDPETPEESDFLDGHTAWNGTGMNESKISKMANRLVMESFRQVMRDKDIAKGHETNEIPYNDKMTQTNTKPLDEKPSKMGTQHKLSSLKGKDIPGFSGYGLKESASKVLESLDAIKLDMPRNVRFNPTISASLRESTEMFKKIFQSAILTSRTLKKENAVQAGELDQAVKSLDNLRNMLANFGRKNQGSLGEEVTAKLKEWMNEISELSFDIFSHNTEVNDEMYHA